MSLISQPLLPLDCPNVSFISIFILNSESIELIKLFHPVTCSLDSECLFHSTIKTCRRTMDPIPTTQPGTSTQQCSRVDPVISRVLCTGAAAGSVLCNSKKSRCGRGKLKLSTSRGKPPTTGRKKDKIIH